MSITSESKKDSTLMTSISINPKPIRTTEKGNKSSRHMSCSSHGLTNSKSRIFPNQNKSCLLILIYLSKHWLVKKVRETMWWITQYYAIISSLVYFNLFCSPSYKESRSHWNCCNDHRHRECCHQDWVRNLKFVPCTEFHVKNKEYCWSNEFIRPSVCAVIKQLEKEEELKR